MTRIVDFPDGLTSASAPVLSGASPEDYSLLNNQSSFVAITGLVFDPLEVTSAFISMEIERIDDQPSEYRQVISLIAAYDGASWSLEAGGYLGDSLISDSIINEQDVQLQMNGNQVEYKSGNMAGGSYSGLFKLSITRIAA